MEHFRWLAQEWKLHIVPELRLTDLTDLCHRFPVVVLFSHFDQDHVEFRDGFIASEGVLEAVPTTFQGILDLCVCHPDSLVKELDARRSCLVKWTTKVAAPAYWLMFYEALFSALSGRPLPYLDALDAITTEFRKEVE